MKIKEVIVVEGKNDSANLKRYFDCDTIITHGLALDDETLDYIAKVNEERGVILFLDPDFPGEKIRHRINSKVKACKNAFIDKARAKTSKKVGIEHASGEDLKESLNNLLTYEEGEKTLSYEDFIDLGLSGDDKASQKREALARHFHLGKCNAKTMYKRLNMLRISKEELLEYLKDERYCNSE